MRILSAVLVVLVALAVVAIIFKWRHMRERTATGRDATLEDARMFTPPQAQPDDSDHADDSGGFVVLRPELGLTAAQVRAELEAAVAPVALQVRPLTRDERVKLELAPVSKAVQGVVRDLMVNRPATTQVSEGTLYRAVLSPGLQLAAAHGGGFRGIAHGNLGIVAHARFVPVVGAAGKVPHPAAKAVAIGLMLALEVVQLKADSDSRALELGRMQRAEDDALSERVAVLRAADQQLGEAIAKLLDGQVPHTELALSHKTASERLERARWFAEQAHDAMVQLLGNPANSPKEVVSAFDRWGGLEGFGRELAMARAAVDLSRKSALADAAAAALEDPMNTYDAYRSQLSARIEDTNDVGARVEEIAALIRTRPIQSRRWRSKEAQSVRRACVAAAGAAPSEALGSSVFLELPDGEVREVLNGEDLFEAHSGVGDARRPTPVAH